MMIGHHAGSEALFYYFGLGHQQIGFAVGSHAQECTTAESYLACGSFEEYSCRSVPTTSLSSLAVRA